MGGVEPYAGAVMPPAFSEGVNLALMSMYLYLAVAYLFIAALAAAAQMQHHRPKLWKMRMNPIEDAHVGEIVNVPVGDDSNTRAFKVAKVEGRYAYGIDQQDEQNHGLVMAAWAFIWPLMLIGVVLGTLSHALHRNPVTVKLHGITAEPKREAPEKVKHV